MHRIVAPRVLPVLLLCTAAVGQELPLPDLHYRCVGPSRGGRVTAVAGVAQEPGTFYFGSTGGGVWKTTDFGVHWRNVSDGFFASPSIGAIRVAPTDPARIWVGTGSDGLRSNVITGRGVYRSADGGDSWEFVGLRDAGQIGAVEIHPQDPATVFVAAIGQAFQPNGMRGLFRTTDEGGSWEKVLFVSESCGIVDVEFHPANPDVLYATAWEAERKPWTIISGGKQGGVFKSTDGGDTWQKLAGGLPDDIIGKADLAVTRAAPDRVYVLVEAPPGEGGLYRSDDAGESFELVSTRSGLLDRPFYYCNVDAHPGDPDIVFVSATGMHRSTDGGESWRRMRTPHGDNHDLWILPDRPEVMIQANDGGANVTLDGGRTWSTQHNQPTAELYQVAVDDRFPYWLYAGQQDNSTIRVPSLPPYPSPSGPTGYWESVGGCETGPVIPKPGAPHIVYANCKGRFGVYDHRTGQERQYYVGAAYMYGHNPRDLEYRFQRVAPVHVSPHDPDVVYHASQYVHRTTDGGVTWETISPDLTAFEPDKQVISGSPITRDITGEEVYSALYEIAESPLQPGLIWVGSNDGPIHVTSDGGGEWTDVGPAGLPPGGRVQTIEPSPHRPEKAYCCVLRYQLGDWRPHVYRTDDRGSTWTWLTGPDSAVPQDFPARVVREDPDREGLLYLGTEFGMFVSFDDGAHWQSFQLDLPVTPVTDMVVHHGDLVLSTMGRSFWICDDLSPLHTLDEQRLAGVHLFPPRPAVRMRYRSSRPGGDGDPEYPSPAATLDYHLPEDVDEIALEITTRGGRVVRRFRGPGRAAGEERGQGMRGPFRRRRGGTLLPGEAGMHRFRWDLRHGGGRRGPRVAPGLYVVRLTAGEDRREALLEVEMDPRVRAAGVTPADLRAQEALALKVRDLADRARRLTGELEERDDAAAAEVLRRLETAEGRYRKPKLNAQIRYLSGMITGADQKPGRDAYERYEELAAELETCESLAAHQEGGPR